MKQSVHDHAFSQVPHIGVQRSAFQRDHGWKNTIDGGYLYPFFWDEYLPGDTFSLNSKFFLRLATPLRPVMDNIWAEVFFFAVPNFQLWTNWHRMMGERDPDPDSSIDYTVPIMTAPVGGYAVGSLQDALGLPTEVAGYEHSALPLRAYARCWNLWFRDQNLQDRVVQDTGDGPDTVTDYVLKRRGKRHDYFTAALPFPQKGDAAELPLGTSAPVTFPTGVTLPATALYLDAAMTTAHGNLYKTAGMAGEVGSTAGVGSGGSQLWIKATSATGPTDAYADLSSATGASINLLRQAIAIQHMYEIDARSGTYYKEIVFNHFGVEPDDQRLMRPEYLGGGRFSININPIAQTSQTDATPQGNLAAMGTAHGSVGFSKSFTQHGIVLGLISVRADLTYQQGLDRRWSRQTRLDYYWPSLAGLGEQAILNKEIYCQGTAGGTDDDGVFGYIPRYDEYRHFNSTICGAFRSTYATSLDTWHLSQEFTSLPVLGDTFIQDDPPFDRVIVTQSEPHFLMDVWNTYRCVRPMPVFGIPGITGRL